METGIYGLLSFLNTYVRLANGLASDVEISEAYSFLRQQNEALKTIVGRVPEGWEGGEPPKEPESIFLPLEKRGRGQPRTDEERQERHQRRTGEKTVPPRGTGLTKFFEVETPPRLDMAIAIDAFVHKAHGENCDILGQAFECDLDLASDIALPLFDFLARENFANPIRKQVRGYEAPELVPGLLLLKMEPLVIAGYASVEMVDKEKHLISREVLHKAFKEFMSRQGRRNVMLSHSNVQVGEILESWTSPTTGQTFLSRVDDKGLFVVAQIYNDTVISKRVSTEVEKGTLSAFSLSGLARNLVSKNGYKDVQDLELAEITICESPVNPGAYFKLMKNHNVLSERIVRVLQKAIPLNWRVRVDEKVDSFLGLKGEWLEQALATQIGRYPMLYGEYELVLSPYRKLVKGVLLSDCSLTLANGDLVVWHPRTSTLGSVVSRRVSKALPETVRDSVRFVYADEELCEKSAPLFSLVARRCR